MNESEKTCVSRLNRSVKILVIEADPVMLFLFQQVLTMADFDVITARFGADGYQLALADRPDVILVNYFLPDVNGSALLEKFQTDERISRIPLLTTTAHWADFGESYFISQGFRGLIKQPLDLRDMGKAIRQVINARD